MCLRFVSSPLFDGCPSQLCLSRWSGSSRRARFRRPVSGVLACVSAIKTWETVSSANPPVCITIQKLSFTLCLISSSKWKKRKTALSELTYGCVRRLLCPVLPPAVHLQGDQRGGSVSLPASAGLYRLRTAGLSGHEGVGQAALWHSGNNSIKINLSSRKIYHSSLNPLSPLSWGSQTHNYDTTMPLFTWYLSDILFAASFILKALKLVLVSTYFMWYPTLERSRTRIWT